ncbi:MAG: MotA/TolQ/ExbB proton channel family protein [Desulfobacterales bacterium]
MRFLGTWALLLAVFICFLSGGSAESADMRVISKKAVADYRKALEESEKRKNEILKNRKSMKKAIAETEQRVEILKSDISEMETAYSELAKKQADLSEKRDRMETDMKGYAGVVRQAAGDLQSIVSSSHVNARQSERAEIIAPIREPDRFPGIDAVTGMADLVFEEMSAAGEVKVFQGEFLGRDGQMKEGTLLSVGPFSAAYSSPEETGFLRFSKAHDGFAALSALPGWGMRRNLRNYMQGEAEAVYFDPSGGSALKRVSHRSTLMEKVKKGGPLVWPIVGIGVLAMILVMERLVFLHRVHANADRLMGEFNQLAAKGDWSGCRKLLAHRKGRPVYNVLMAGFGAVDQSRENLENVLQEAILKELPRLERFLPALNVMAAVSPLIGLLGTVTGMIGTFQVITLYGTGDPRLMSGGISEALVTTMLGLAVAIPVMLFHAFLRRRIEHIVGDMEEKAVALSNIICRQSQNNAAGHTLALKQV